MLGFVAVGGIAALGLASGGEASAGSHVPRRAPDLELRLKLEDAGGRLAPPFGAADGAAVAPPCIADVCQPRVDVPGFATRFGRPQRSELVASLLARAGVEPLASIAWVFVATGLRVDWSPPAYDAGDPGAARGGGWGSAFVRLKLRIDATNRPVLPDRDQIRAKQQRTAVTAPRA